MDLTIRGNLMGKNIRTFDSWREHLDFRAEIEKEQQNNIRVNVRVRSLMKNHKPGVTSCCCDAF